MKGWWCVAVWGILLVQPLSAQSDKFPGNMQSDVYFLAHDSLQGRAPDTDGARIAAQWIADRFQHLQLQPVFDHTYYQPFIYQESGRNIPTENVLAQTNPGRPCRLIIAAHYDHLGRGQHHSREVFPNRIHNGADDNASGTAMLLELAKWCMNTDSLSGYNVLFVCFSGHESGLFGSQLFVQYPPFLLDSSMFVLNLDMVGRLDTTQKPPPLYFRIPENSHWPTWMLPASQEGLNVVVKKTDQLLDHTAFERMGIPAATFSTGIHDDYHKSTDDAERINYAGMEQVLQYVKGFILKLIH
ncbi:MAG: M28 family peptidase [Bacteroidetes bacterium]|nr:M28 family peptidase [Bacteroidota bacterium]